MNYNVNPMQLIQMIKSGQNPQQLMLNVLQQRTQNNPLMQNLFQLAQNNNTSAIEEIARNIYSEKGLDFDKEFNSFKKTLGL
jgi:hypothetical protein